MASLGHNELTWEQVYTYPAYLGEISHQMTAMFVIGRKHIKEEWFNIIIQGFVVEEEFCQ